MLLARYNQFKITVPELILPKWCTELYTDILRDAGLIGTYITPFNAVTEGITGLDLPGLHINLVEQTKQAVSRNSSYTALWPKGTNAMRIIDDNEIALTIRHIDGFLTYHALAMAIEYMADDNAQTALGETYKSIGNIKFEQKITDNYTIVTDFCDCVYSAIDGTSFKYNLGASEQTFSVRLKYIQYMKSVYYKGKCITERTSRHTT
jgi:hypothetical protein